MAMVLDSCAGRLDRSRLSDSAATGARSGRIAIERAASSLPRSAPCRRCQAKGASRWSRSAPRPRPRTFRTRRTRHAPSRRCDSSKRVRGARPCKKSSEASSSTGSLMHAAAPAWRVFGCNERLESCFIAPARSFSPEGTHLQRRTQRSAAMPGQATSWPLCDGRAAQPLGGGPPVPPPVLRMLVVLDVDEVDLLVAVEDERPVTTWSPAARPETTWVFTPSVMPVWTCTGVRAPLRRTSTVAVPVAGLLWAYARRGVGHDDGVVGRLSDDGHGRRHGRQELDVRRVHRDQHGVGHHVRGGRPRGLDGRDSPREGLARIRGDREVHLLTRLHLADVSFADRRRSPEACSGR